MSEKLNKAKNNKGAKGYRDFIISQLDKDFTEETFPASDNSIVENATNSFTKDFAKTDFTADGSPKSSPEISHLASGQKHSFSHEVDEDYIRKNKGMAKLQQKVDSPADTEKEVY
jgi:hypothetical protein